MNFKTTLNNSDILDWNYPMIAEDDYLENSKLVIEWTAEIEAREYGIKGIYAIITKVGFSATYIKPGEEEDEETEIDMELDMDDWTIETSIQGNEYGSMEPTYADIDFKLQKLEITF